MAWEYGTTATPSTSSVAIAHAHSSERGGGVYVLAGVPHGFRVGPAPSRKPNLYTPAAMVGYFDELSAALADGEADDDRLTRIADRYGMDVIGPVPEGYL